LISIPYLQTLNEADDISRFLLALQAEFKEYNLMMDPYVLELVELMNTGDDEAERQLFKIIQTHKTYCYECLRKLVDKASDIYNQLGGWATDWYLRRCVKTYVGLLQPGDLTLDEWSDKEKQHLGVLLERALRRADDMDRDLEVSLKVAALIKTLVDENTADFRGIIFVERRAVAITLAHILREHPETQALFSVGAFVGSTSSASLRKSGLADIVELKQRPETLLEFRSGQKNLLVSTNVLEEGIDVPSCDNIMCFDKPKNLKSFIQRRGRARKVESKYFIMLTESEARDKYALQWRELEEHMLKAYMEDLRYAQLAEQREQTIEHDNFELRLSSTGYVSPNMTDRRLS